MKPRRPANRQIVSFSAEFLVLSLQMRDYSVLSAKSDFREKVKSLGCGDRRGTGCKNDQNGVGRHRGREWAVEGC